MSVHLILIYAVASPTINNIIAITIGIIIHACLLLDLRECLKNTPSICSSIKEQNLTLPNLHRRDIFKGCILQQPEDPHLAYGICAVHI